MSSSGFGISKCFISIVPFTMRGNVEFLIVLMKELIGIFISVWIIKLHIEAIIFNEWNIITRVTENSISTIKFYRVFLKIYER